MNTLEHILNVRAAMDSFLADNGPIFVAAGRYNKAHDWATKHRLKPGEWDFFDKPTALGGREHSYVVFLPGWKRYYVYNELQLIKEALERNSDRITATYVNE